VRKKYLAALGFAAVFVLTALSASPAFATSEFLLNGEAITTEMNFEGESEIAIEDMGGLSKTTILCSKYEDYSGFWPFRLLLEWLMLDRKPLLSNGVEGTPGVLADCVNHAAVCSGEPTVAVIGLSWEQGELVLEGETFVMLVLKNEANEPGFEIKCTILGIPMTDLCTGEMSWVLHNVTGGVNAELAAGIELNCSIGGAKQGLVSGSSLLTSSLGTLSVS
jgi:hypothetical protein